MPSQAASTRDIRNFKGHFRGATKTIMEGGHLGQVVLERSLAKLQASVRTEISFNLGAALNLETLDSGKKVYDCFAAALRVRLCTARRRNQPAPADEAIDLHELFSSGVLDLLAEDNDPFTEALLPYYKVDTIAPAGTASDFDPLNFEDFTDLNFALRFSVRSNAWPAAYLLRA